MPEFSIVTSGAPQNTGTRWLARRAGPVPAEFLVGQTVSFNDGDGRHRGLYQTRVLNEVPPLFYDRVEAEGDIGLWAHFIWPTVVAESAGGHHLLINTYDRARFTFGFYQLAAHTPNDNLILLFRALLQLPRAADYFPDLTLKGGKVHRRENGALTSLEVVTNVQRPNGRFEDQLVGFMSYLNPDTFNVGEIEALNSAKLMDWLLNDPEAVAISVRIAMAIMRRKVKAQASTFSLRGKDPRLAIWVSDIRHQGRGSKDEIKGALALSSLSERLAGLAAIGASSHRARIASVKNSIQALHREGRFNGVVLGDPQLPL